MALKPTQTHTHRLAGCVCVLPNACLRFIALEFAGAAFWLLVLTWLNCNRNEYPVFYLFFIYFVYYWVSCSAYVCAATCATCAERCLCCLCCCCWNSALLSVCLNYLWQCNNDQAFIFLLALSSRRVVCFFLFFFRHFLYSFSGCCCCCFFKRIALNFHQTGETVAGGIRGA